MTSDADSVTGLDEALQDKRFSRSMQALVDAFLHAKHCEPDSVSGLLREQWLQLVELLAAQSDKSKKLEFDDTGDSINPLRSLWRLCFEKFSASSVKATNHVSANWQSSGSRNIGIQRNVVARGVTIERVFILEDKLSEQTLHELRFNIIQQLNAGIILRIIRSQAMEQYVDTSRLQSKDFIIFDDQLVYITLIDTANLDKRNRKNAHVQLYYSKELLAFADTAWSDLLKYSDPLTHQNLHEWVDPYGKELDLGRS